MKDAIVKWKRHSHWFWGPYNNRWGLPELCDDEVFSTINLPENCRSFVTVFHEEPRADCNDFRMTRPITETTCLASRRLSSVDTRKYLLYSVRKMLAHYYDRGYRYVHLEYDDE